MDEKYAEMSRPKMNRLFSQKSKLAIGNGGIRTGVNLSPMTNLAHNLSGTSLDSTPRRRTSPYNSEENPTTASAGSLALSTDGDGLLAPFGEKENSYTSIVPFLGSPDKTKGSGEDFLVRRSPGRRNALAKIDVNSPIKAGFVKPPQPTATSSTRLPSIEDVDSQDSGCFSEDSKYFKYPEPLSHRRMSDRNASPASIRSYSSSYSGGSLKYDGPAKLDFSFTSSGEDEGIPYDLIEEEDTGLPTSATLSQLIATPLSEKASRQFSSHEDGHGVESSQAESALPGIDLIRVPHEATDKSSSRTTFRRSQSMFDHTTPNSRSSGFSYDSPVARRGLFVNDEDTGSSPVAPLGLHVARLRTMCRPTRDIRTVGGPPFKRSVVESPTTADSGSQTQENKRRKDDNGDRPVSLCSDLDNSSKALCVSKLPPRIHRCHSETEATIKRALQLSTEVPNLIGDCTVPFALPLTSGKHQDLKSITPETLVDLMSGKFSDTVEKFTIVDCRYPYEYEHGHIDGALNLWTKDMVWDVFMKGKTAPAKPNQEQGGSEKRHIIVFHCEFSSERGPALSRYLRNKDRDDNKDHYPVLHWPEIYLLHGGYKAFYEKYNVRCVPKGYLPMNETGYEEDLRRCRAKTKSCSGDGRSGRPMTKSTSRRLESRFSDHLS